MKLHVRIILLLALTFAAFLSIGAGAIYTVLRPAFERLEQDQALTNVNRVEKALQTQLTSLDQKVHDWSWWVDTYEFVQGKRPGYIDANLSGSTLANLDLTFMAFYDDHGNPIWTGAQDPRTKELISPAELTDPSIIKSLAPGKQRDDRRSGLWIGPTGSYLVGSRPVLNSDDEQAPAMGFVLFGRRLDQDFIAALGAQTEVAFSLVPYSSGANVMADHALEVGREPGLLKHAIAWTDIAGTPQLDIIVSTPREISAVGNRTIRISGMFLVTAALIDMTVIGLAITFLIARPIRNLTQQVQRIASSGDLTVRLGWRRRDEIGILASQFDHMMAELAHAREQLLEMSYRLGRSDVTAGVLHNVRNALNPLANQVQRARNLLGSPVGTHLAQAAAELGDTGTTLERRRKLVEYMVATAQQESELRQAVAKEVDDANQALGAVERILAHQEATAHHEVAAQSLSLSDVVKETLRHIGSATADVSICVDPSVERAPEVLAHQPIAVHVLHNLVNNALTAVRAAQRSDPRIEISAHYEPASRHVVLKVADNGIGIASDHLPELFRNGFTTKIEGRGGEGLHWCANAIARLKGRIWAESPGQDGGATFYVELATA